MHKSLKHLIVVAGFAPLFAFAQTAGGDADKTAAIKELLTTMNVDQAIRGQGEVLENGAKQEAPLVLEQALVENKSLDDKQKQAAVDKLKQNGAVQRMTDGAGKAFETDTFRKDALQAHYATDQGSDHVPEDPERPSVHDQPGQGDAGSVGQRDAEVRSASRQVHARHG